MMRCTNLVGSTLARIRVVCVLLTGCVGWGLAPCTWGSPEVPGAPSSDPIVLVGGTVYPVSGPPIADARLVIERGKILAVGRDVKVPAGAQQVDVHGKRVYPALFDAYTDMGLVEINSIRATVDRRETGSLNPNVKSWVAVNPDSEIIPVTRSNGVLLTLTAPSGGLIAGKSAVIQLDGWTFEDLALRTDIGMHVNWPSMSSARRDEGDSSSAPSPRNSPLKPLRDAFDTARAYQRARVARPQVHPVDARWDALLPVLDRQMPLIVDAEEWQQIEAAVAFAVEQNVRLIIHGGYDAEMCAELLKKHKVPVIVAGTYRMPHRDSDAYDAPFTLPERLRRAGVQYALSSTGRFGATGVRNLPYHAAMAVAFGLSPEDALRAITLSPAEVLGVADRVGSLDVGKDATLFIATGDPLDTETQVEAAYVQGRPVELNDRHKRLWKKYEEKYRRLSADTAP
ncbi:MAG: amidohydrolase family protein [Pirellulaceae bacterium]